MQKQRTLFVLSGNAENILSHFSPEETTVLPFGEKELRNVKSVIARFRNESGEIIIGTKSLDLQRFKMIFKTILFLSGKMTGCIADESGRKISYNALSFLFLDSLKLLAEIAATTWTIGSVFFDLKKSEKALS